MIGARGSAATGSAIVDNQIYRDLVGNRPGQDSCGLLYAGPEARRRRHRCRIEQEIDGNAAGRHGDAGIGSGLCERDRGGGALIPE